MLIAAIPDQRARHDSHGECVSDARRRLTNATFAEAVRAMTGQQLPCDSASAQTSFRGAWDVASPHSEHVSRTRV